MTRGLARRLRCEYILWGESNQYSYIVEYLKTHPIILNIPRSYLFRFPHIPSNLTKLILSHNTLKNIPDCSAALALTYLDLSYNEILHMDMSSVAVSLCHLNMAHNKISKISLDDKIFTNLKYFNIGHNEVSIYPSLTAAFPNLEYCYATGSVQPFMQELAKFPKLKQLYLRAKQLKSFNSDIISNLAYTLELIYIVCAVRLGPIQWKKYPKLRRVLLFQDCDILDVKMGGGFPINLRASKNAILYHKIHKLNMCKIKSINVISFSKNSNLDGLLEKSTKFCQINLPISIVSDIVEIFDTSLIFP